MSASPAATANPARPQPLYFINGPADFLLAGGLSILTFAGFYFFLSDTRQESAGVIALAGQLVWVCNWPHFAATNYRLYHSRDNIKQYPLTALGIPWLILALVIGSVVYPATIAPYFIIFFLLWSPYHFSGQTVGVTMIYARRAGFFVGTAERFALSSFVFATFLSSTIRGQIIFSEQPKPQEYWGIRYQILGLPPWTQVAADVWMYLMALLFGLLVLRWCIQKRRMLPPIVLLPAAAQFVWFVLSAEWPAFNRFVPFFHSLQYLLIAWSMQLKEKLDREQARPAAERSQTIRTVRAVSMVLIGLCIYPVMKWLMQYDQQIIHDIPAAAYYLPPVITGIYAAYIGFSLTMDSRKTCPSYAYVLYESLRWFDLNIMVGACLFFVSPILLSHFFKVDPFLAIGVTAAAVQIHHFFVDGVIWKLKRSSVSSPLMVNISDLLEPPPEAQPIPIIAGAPGGVLAQAEKA